MSQLYDGKVPMSGTTAIKVDRATINDAFDALLTAFSGDSAPANPKRGQYWLDTASGNQLLKQWTGAAWQIVRLEANRADRCYITVPVTLTASVNQILLALPIKATVVAVAVTPTAGTAGSDGSNNWKVQIANKTAAVDLRATAWGTDTDSEFGAYTKEAIAIDQNADAALDDVIEIQFAKNGTGGGDPGSALVQLTFDPRI